MELTHSGIQCPGAGEMPHWLKALAALPQDAGSLLSPTW